MECVDDFITLVTLIWVVAPVPTVCNMYFSYLRANMHSIIPRVPNT